MIGIPADGYSVDWRVDLAGLRQALGPQKILQGNLDPAVLLSGPDHTARAARRLLATVPREGHVVNLGHGILPQAPLDSVGALIDAVHAEAAGAGSRVVAGAESWGEK
jgi:uroporphyrinogen decarboxylase